MQTVIAMASSTGRSRQNSERQSQEDDTAPADPKASQEVSPDKAAEIARNLQQVFMRIGQQPVPERLQAIIDKMAEEERRNE